MKQKKISYVNVDSANRRVTPQLVYEKIYNLPAYPLYFTHGTRQIEVEFPGHSFKIGDNIVLHNVVSKNINLTGVIMIKRGSRYLRVNHQNHGLSLRGRYNANDSGQFIVAPLTGMLPLSYYNFDDVPDRVPNYVLRDDAGIAKLRVKMSGISSSGNGNIAGIPVNYLNGNHVVDLIFTKSGQEYISDPNCYLIKLPTKSTINYTDDVNSPAINLHLKYLDIYGIPLNLLNASDDNDERQTYLTVVSTTSTNFTVEIPEHLNSIVDQKIVDADQNISFDKQEIKARGGGNQVYVRRIAEIIPGYPDCNSYVYQLDDNYRNVVAARIISSIFPNSQRLINNTNNKLYWRNLEDGDETHHLSITPGNYSVTELAETLQREFSETLRKDGRVHTIDVDIDETTDAVTFSSYRILTQTVDDTYQAIRVPDNQLHFVFNGEVSKFGDFFYLSSTSSFTNLLRNAIPAYKFGDALDNLYRFVSDGIGILEIFVGVLFNFHVPVELGVAGNAHVVASINTNTLLEGFRYDSNTKRVYLPQHELHRGDILVTDQFVDVFNESSIKTKVYRCTDVESPTIIKVEPVDTVLWYNGLVIGDGDVYWLNDAIVDIVPDSGQKNFAVITNALRNFEVGDYIEISNSGSVNGVPDDIINGRFQIFKNFGDNYYISLPKYTPSHVAMIRKNNVGFVTIKYPSKFQLIFTTSDTLGRLLGFQKTGTPVAITPYSHIISNRNSYLDYTPTVYPKLDMTGDKYFYLCCRELPCVSNCRPAENVFSIIQWTDNPGTIIYDAHVPTVKEFNPALKSLTQLSFSMVNRNGDLIDFNGVDHSFVIEITQEIESLDMNL